MCQKFHDENVLNVKASRLQVDEIWSFVYCKAKNVLRSGGDHNTGDAWTWTAIDPETKLIVGWLVGRRDSYSANAFMKDIQYRLSNRVQLTSDGYKSYIDAVEIAFKDNVDFAQLKKIYGKPIRNGEIDNRVQYLRSEKITITGNPDERFVSTSHVERHNLFMRTHIKRYTRKTNAFSKKFQNHCYSCAIWFVYYNFVRVNPGTEETPAMRAGLADRPLTILEIVNLSCKNSK